MGIGPPVELLWLRYYVGIRAIIFVVDSNRVGKLGTPHCQSCLGQHCAKTQSGPEHPRTKRPDCDYDAKYWLWHMLDLKRDHLHRLDANNCGSRLRAYYENCAALPEDAPVLVLANKQDLPGAATAEQVAEKLGLQTTRMRFDVDGVFGCV